MEQDKIHFPPTNISSSRSVPHIFFVSILLLLLLVATTWSFIFPPAGSTDYLGVSTFFNNNSK